MSTNTAPSPMQRKAGVPPMNPSAWGIDTRQTASPPPSSAALPQPQPHDDVGPPTFGFAPSSLMESSQQMGPSVSHEEFLHTYAMIQYVAQPALVSVVRTLLDENPWLTTQIRLLCDQAMQQLMALAGQQSQHASPQAPGAFHSQMGQHQSQHHPHHQQQQQPQHPLGVATPPSSARKASANASRRNTREEETDLCAVHGNWRSIKHLQYNASTRQVECIPGFHCLENNTTGSNLPTPTKRPHNVSEGLPPMGPSGMVGHGSIPPSPHKTLANPPPPRLSSRGTTPPPAPFLNAHTPPPEPAAVASPTDPDETRRLEALLNELHKTTES